MTRDEPVAVLSSVFILCYLSDDIPPLRTVCSGIDDVGLRSGVIRHGPVSVRAAAGQPGLAGTCAAAPQLYTGIHQDYRPR